MKIIIESIRSQFVKKWIKTEYFECGHDCWGNTEHSAREFIYIGGKRESIHEGCYVAHDGENPLYVGFISHLPDKVSEHLDKSLERKNKEKRYSQYMKLSKEFSIESDENNSIKRDYNIKKITD